MKSRESMYNTAPNCWEDNRECWGLGRPECPLQRQQLCPALVKCCHMETQIQGCKRTSDFPKVRNTELYVSRPGFKQR